MPKQQLLGMEQWGERMAITSMPYLWVPWKHLADHTWKKNADWMVPCCSDVSLQGRNDTVVACMSGWTQKGNENVGIPQK